MNDFSSYGIWIKAATIRLVTTSVVVAAILYFVVRLGDRLIRLIVTYQAWLFAGMCLAGIMLNLFMFVADWLEWKRAERYDHSDDDDMEEQPDEPPAAYFSAFELARLERIKAKRPWKHDVDMGLFLEIRITEDRMARMAYQIKFDGKTFCHEDFAKHWNGFTRPEWKKIADLMMRRNYVKWQSPEHHRMGMQITEAGALFLDELIDHSPMDKKGVKECARPIHERVRTDVHSPFFSAAP